MSHSTLYLVPKKGQIIPWKDIGNSHGSAPVVWDYLSHKYDIKDENGYRISKSFYAKLWDLQRNPSIPKLERVALIFTFDNFMIGKKYFPILQEALIRVGSSYRILNPENVNHLETIAKELDEMKKDERCTAFCINHTSVCDQWYYKGRLYKMGRDKGHWLAQKEYRDLFPREK